LQKLNGANCFAPRGIANITRNTDEAHLCADDHKNESAFRRQWISISSTPG